MIAGMQQARPPWMERRGDVPQREPRRFFVRRFVPESDEHIEAADDGPGDALLVVSDPAVRREAERTASLATAQEELAAAVATEAELVELHASAGEDERAAIKTQIDAAVAEQARLAGEIEKLSQPSTTRLSFLFRLRSGELTQESRIDGAQLVAGDGDPIPLQFELGEGRSVTMTAEVDVATTVFVIVHLTGLAGAQVEMLLMGGGTILPISP